MIRWDQEKAAQIASLVAQNNNSTNVRNRVLLQFSFLLCVSCVLGGHIHFFLFLFFV